MKKATNYMKPKFAAFVIVGSFLLQADMCVKNDETNACHPEISVESSRLQTTPEFKIVASGFNPGATVTVSVHKQPGGLPVNQDIGTAVADNYGTFTFTWHPDGGYLPLPVDTNAAPYFSATDDKGCSGKSSYTQGFEWYNP